jgi:hypothetical protein
MPYLLSEGGDIGSPAASVVDHARETCPAIDTLRLLNSIPR